MKITDVRTFAVDCFRTNWVFVKIYTDEGVTGTELTVDGGMSCQLYPRILNDLKRQAMERGEM